MFRPQYFLKPDIAHSHIEQKDDETLFRKLTQRPLFAAPTALLFIFSMAGLLGGTYLYYSAPHWFVIAILINSICLYTSYSVLHESTHRAISTNKDINDWFGRMCLFCIQPLTPFGSFRDRHMQHHRYLHTEKDPEAFLHLGPQWLLPIKWLIADVVYFIQYLLRWNSLAKSAHVEILCHIFLCVTIMSVCIAHQHYEILIWWIIPSRITMLITTVIFSYLPHAIHWDQQQTPAETVENSPHPHSNLYLKNHWIITPVCMAQNYHLIHHLYPTVPFYRYRRVWYSRLNHHLSILQEHSEQNRKEGYTPLRAHGRIYPIVQ